MPGPEQPNDTPLNIGDPYYGTKSLFDSCHFLDGLDSEGKCTSASDTGHETWIVVCEE